MMWESARSGKILGERVFIPKPKCLFTHLAIHAFEHLFSHTGRIIQWLDLVLLSPLINSFEDLPHPNRVYPPLRFINRALPKHADRIKTNQMAKRVNYHILKWSKSVPLNRHCGPVCPTHVRALVRLRLRWNRWKPSTWRMTIVYGEKPTVLLYLKQIRQIISKCMTPLQKGNEYS